MNNEEYYESAPTILVCSTLFALASCIAFSIPFLDEKPIDAGSVWFMYVGLSVFLVCLWLIVKTVKACDQYKRDLKMKKAIKAFNEGNARPSWYRMMTLGSPVLRNVKRDGVIQLESVTTLRRCSVDDNGKFHFREEPWYARDSFIPGRYIVSKTTGKLTFMYLKKIY